MDKTIRSFRHLNKCNTVFFLCDIQEKFRPVMPLFGNLVQNVNKMLNAARIFKIPVIATEQYPEKLGKTDKELDICGIEPIPKTKFSMWTCEVQDELKKLNSVKEVVLFGIETHACVEQTAIDLIENKFDVFLLADCTCSRLNQDRDQSIERMRHGGVSITTSEAVLFNLLQDKNNPEFDEIRKIVKDPSKDMELSVN